MGQGGVVVSGKTMRDLREGEGRFHEEEQGVGGGVAEPGWLGCLGVRDSH